MNEENRRDGGEAGTLLEVLKRRLWIVVLVAAAVGAGAYLLSRLEKPSYTASAKLLLRGPTQNASQPAFSAPTPTAAVDLEALMTSTPVLARTQRVLTRRLGARRAAQALSGISTVVAQDSAIVVISASAPSGTLAAVAANTLAKQNVAYRRATVLFQIRRALGAVRTQLDAEKRTANSFSRSSAIADYRQRLVDLTQAEAVQDGQADIVNSAGVPTAPTSPKPTRNGLIGAFAGLLLGLALVLAKQQADRRLRRPCELEASFGFPVLASVPKSRALAMENGNALEKLPSAEAEAFQMLRANLRYLESERELKSIVVTSTGVGEGKSTVAMNLAKADALIGTRVLLIEADVRRPSLAGTLGLPSGEGLAGFLSDPSLTLADVILRVPVSRSENGVGPPATMDVMVAGETSANPAGLIESDRLRELMQKAEERYELVVIDTAPAGSVADAIPIMSLASAVVIVGRVGRLTGVQADGLREQLERINAPVCGLVANFSSSPQRSAYIY